mgnify:CR=1 FL=1
MSAYPRNLITAFSFVVGALFGACGGDPPADSGTCWEQGTVDQVNQWCEHEPHGVPLRNGVAAYPVVIRYPRPEEGCYACDAEAVDEMMEAQILVECFEIPAWERGCVEEKVNTQTGEPECVFMAFAFSNAC